MNVSEHIRKRHNETLLLYHLIFPVKHRKKVFNSDIKQTLKNVYEDMSVGCEIYFVEIWVDNDHMHFLIQSVPKFSVTVWQYANEEVINYYLSKESDLSSSMQG